MSKYDGHRIYNGCPDSTLQARWDNEARLLRNIQKKEATILDNIKINYAEARCAYFPMEAKYQVHVWGFPLSRLHERKIDALNEAMSGYRVGRVRAC